MRAALTSKRTVNRKGSDVLSFPETYQRLTAEQALRVAIDTQVFAVLRDLESLDGGRAVQAVYVALLRRIPNVTPDRKRIAIDCGFSESSVKRAIGLLERCKLIAVERQKGRGSTYEIIDLRASEAASASLAMIRKLAREAKENRASLGRTTCEPSVPNGRVNTEPTRRVSSGQEVGSVVAHKEAKKDQAKQQGVACSSEDRNVEVRESLRRWELSSAGYIIKRGHPKSIPTLASNLEMAAKVIDRAMSMTTWSENAGVGARVAYLRDHAAESARAVKAESVQKQEESLLSRNRAEAIAMDLPTLASENTGGLDDERRNILLERALERLHEPSDVIRHLRDVKQFRERLIGSEVVRESLERGLDAMSEDDFGALCSRFFAREPGLKRFYANGNRRSTGFRLHLLAFMAAEIERDAGR